MKLEYIAVAVTLVLQLGGLIWAAAKFSSSVTALDRTTQSLADNVRLITKEVTNLHTDVAVLKDRLDLRRRTFGEPE